MLFYAWIADIILRFTFYFEPTQTLQSSMFLVWVYLLIEWVCFVHDWVIMHAVSVTLDVHRLVMIAAGHRYPVLLYLRYWEPLPIVTSLEITNCWLYATGTCVPSSQITLFSKELRRVGHSQTNRVRGELIETELGGEPEKEKLRITDKRFRRVLDQD